MQFIKQGNNHTCSHQEISEEILSFTWDYIGSALFGSNFAELRANRKLVLIKSLKC